MSLINGYVGTYASPDAPGTYRFTLDADTGVLSAPALVYPQANTKYAAWHGGLLATVTESGGRSGLALLDASDPGCPVLDSVLTEDATACFLTWHEGRIYSANYHDGHVLIYEPACGGLRLVRRLEIGAEAGCHQALFHGRWLLVPCLCLDQVRIFDLENGLAPAGTLNFPAGTGPRHGVFNADHTRLYLVSEKSNQLFTYAVDGLSFTPVQADTLLPPDCAGRADAAADLFLGLIHDGSVFGGVGRGRNDLEKIAARRFGDLPRHGARIAAVGEIGHQHLRAGCGLRLCIHIG